MGLKVVFLVIAFMIASSINRASSQSFKARQAKHSRVRDAIAEKEPSIRAYFKQKGFAYPPGKIFIRIFKRERTLELWASRAGQDRFEMLKAYNFCATSGGLGPKRRQGDEQIPEGFYYVDRFNPASNFHLSLGINYPNESDRILGVKGRLGGDIFIHGGCATIGCVPITDDRIKELYLIAIEARSAGQRQIPVHIFPARLNQSGMKLLESRYPDNAGINNFWTNLKQGYDFFEKHRRLPAITVDRQGRYVIKG